MCGIAGIAGRPDDDLMRSMTAVLAHRGPDGEGFFSSAEVALGHRRLSIIDLDAGAQPMSYADGALWITYNGEVYNFLALRQTLEGLGHRFKTRSDTEVLLAAYAQWGEACVEKLQGMFAFAVWDARAHTLFLARDHIGVKPLYYTEIGDTLYFASEMKSLLLCPGLDRSMDLESLDDYLTYLYTVPPRTIFKSIRQLPPAHCGTWRDGRFNVRRYWRPCCQSDSRYVDETSCVEAIDALLTDVLDRYCIADVPLGAFLSGGLDSSTIAYYMTQQGAPPLTFTVGFGAEGAKYDESEEARRTASLLGTRHHELKASQATAELLPVMVGHFDEPFGNPTALLTYSICALVRDHVKVVLSGDGGDEGFGGYPRYRGLVWAQHFRRIPHWVRRLLINPLVQCLPESASGNHSLRRLREFSAGAMLDPVDMYAHWIGYYTHAERQVLYTGDVANVLSGRDSHAYIRTLAEECDAQDPLTQAMCVDIQSFLPNNVLHYGDRMSMAQSLEVRVPFADPEVLGLLLRMPGALKMRAGKSKYLLRRLLASRLPGDVVSRRKQGFNPPMGVWLNGPLRDIVADYLSPESIRAGGCFNPKTVDAMIQAHRQGHRDYTWHIWSLIVFEQWRRIHAS